MISEAGMRIDRFAKLAVTWSQTQAKKRQDPVTGEWRIISTHCNRFVALCANEVGCRDLGAPDEWTANQMISKLEKLVQEDRGWHEVDVFEAQNAANRFNLVVAGSKMEPHGHVCVVIPGEIAWSKKHEADLPIVANAGVDNFYGRLASFAFGKDKPPRFWVWLGPYATDSEVTT